MKKVIIALAVVILGVGAFYYARKKNKSKELAAVTTITPVTQGPIERTVEATGEVTPLNRVEVKPPIPGRIEQTLVEEGHHVKKGQVLAWMSSSDRAAILDAARAQGEEALRRWEDTYKPTPIVAPLTGVIIVKNGVVGQTVDSGTVLFAMADRLIVLAQVDEADIGSVKLKTPARITLDAYPDRSIEGEVNQILYEGKNVSNVITYGVKIVPKEVPDFFRSQMTANVVLILERRDDVLLVPVQALRSSSQGRQVLLHNPSAKPTPRDVETGIENGTHAEIVSGLSLSDQVVISKARYVPQKGPQTSPFTMGGRGSGRPQGSGDRTTGGGGRRRDR